MPLNNRHSILFLLCVLFFSYKIEGQIYVNRFAEGRNDGTSWTDAYQSLQDALNASDSEEIWVATGRYFPGQNNIFNISSDVKIYGGFQGNEILREERDPNRFETILSADNLGNDINEDFEQNRSDNSLHVLRIDSNAKNVRIDGFTISGASAIPIADSAAIKLDAWGGAVQILGDANFIDCEFTANEAGRGGAIGVFKEGKVRFTRCNFRNNQAVLGGAIYSEGESSFRQGQIFENQATLSGGAYYSNNGMDSFKYMIITFNRAVFGGFGLEVNNNSVFSQCLIQSNEATDFDMGDAGVSYFFDTDGSASTRYFNCTIESNRANRYGGVFAIDKGNRNIWIDSCFFRNNNARGSGGVVFGSFDSLSSLLFTAVNSEFESNRSQFGDGGVIFGQSPLNNYTFENVSFYSNNARDYGGAVSSLGGSYTFTNCTFRNNISLQSGGALDMNIGQNLSFNQTQCRVLNSSFESNTTNAFGGALLAANGAQIQIDGGSFFNNSCDRFGGAIQIQNDGTTFTLARSYFRNNFTNQGDGGAINIVGQIPAVIDSCVFQSNIAGFINKARTEGGALHINGNPSDTLLPEVNILASTFNGNESGKEGGAVSAEQVHLDLINSLFYENRATEAGEGGALMHKGRAKGSKLNLINNTFAFNEGEKAAHIAQYTQDSSNHSADIVLINNLVVFPENDNPSFANLSDQSSATSLGGNYFSDSTIADFAHPQDHFNQKEDPFDISISFEVVNPEVGNKGVYTQAPTHDITDLLRLPCEEALITPGCFEYDSPLERLCRDTMVSSTQIQEEESIAIYPSLVHDRINIEFHGDGILTELRFYDMTGRLVYSQSVNKAGPLVKVILDGMHAWPKGMYLLQLNSSQGLYQKKIIKL